MKSIVLQLMNSQAANCGIAKISLFLFYNLCLFALVSYSVAEIKYPSKFIWLPIPGYSQSIITGKSRQQELEAATSTVKNREQ